jgi:hypothetical protein
MTLHCTSSLLRVATRADGACAASAKTAAVVRRAAVGDPPLPFYFLKTPPFFSNTRAGAAYTKRRDQTARQECISETQYQHRRPPSPGSRRPVLDTDGKPRGCSIIMSSTVGTAIHPRHSGVRGNDDLSK